VDIVDSQGSIPNWTVCGMQKRQLSLQITLCNSNNRKLFGIFKLDKMLGIQE
jgi:phage replication-related protein YjqB (UPF0714/DUF867 family)